MPPVFGYRPSSNNNHIPSGHTVDVIANFKTTGEFIPMYFRFTADNEERFPFKINSISSMKDKPGVKIFVCTYLANGYKNVITLCFDEAITMWSVG